MCAQALGEEGKKQWAAEAEKDKARYAAECAAAAIAKALRSVGADAEEAPAAEAAAADAQDAGGETSDQWSAASWLSSLRAGGDSSNVPSIAAVVAEALRRAAASSPAANNGHGETLTLCGVRDTAHDDGDGDQPTFVPLSFRHFSEVRMLTAHEYLPKPERLEAYKDNVWVLSSTSEARQLQSEAERWRREQQHGCGGEHGRWY